MRCSNKEDKDMTRSEEIRSILGIGRAEFARRYKIPIRTLEDWDSGKSNPPAYVVELLERAVKEDKEAKEMANRHWYAVQRDRDDDWGDGSFDRKEAIKMLKEQGYGLIAVIDGDVCIEEIEFDDIAD
jgi:putative transcriptional regulator